VIIIIAWGCCCCHKRAAIQLLNIPLALHFRDVLIAAGIQHVYARTHNIFLNQQIENACFDRERNIPDEKARGLGGCC
jgi:hypothetical protein